MYAAKNFDDFFEKVKSENVRIRVLLAIPDKGCGEIVYTTQINDKTVQYNQKYSRKNCKGKTADELYASLREEAKENLECLEILGGVDYEVSNFGGK